MVYKCVNNLTPDYLRKRFQYHLEIHQRDTRQKSAGSRLGKGPLSFVKQKFLIPYLSLLEIRKVSVVLKK